MRLFSSPPAYTLRVIQWPGSGLASGGCRDRICRLLLLGIDRYRCASRVSKRLVGIPAKRACAASRRFIVFGCFMEHPHLAFSSAPWRLQARVRSNGGIHAKNMNTAS